MLDAREKPADWPSGFTGINTKGPTEKPPLDYRTEVFALNTSLADAAYAISHNRQTRRQRRRQSRPREVQLRACQSAAQRDSVRHSRRRYLVVRQIYRRKGAVLDETTDGWQRRLLHDAAGRQRHLRSAQTRHQCQKGRFVAPRDFTDRIGFRQAVRFAHHP